MKSYIIIRKLAVSVLICMTTSMAFAFDTGVLKGRITNNQGEPLPFANVAVTHKMEGEQKIELKSQFGSVTDINGYYALSSTGWL